MLNVKDHLAGKRGICPDCQSRLEIPLASLIQGSSRAPFVPGASITLKEPVSGASNPGPVTPSVAPTPPAPSVENGAAVDPIAEAPQLQWYVQPQGSTSRYGPAAGETMRSWMRAGRVAPDALIWREGWPNWRIAQSVFPQLVQETPAEPAVRAASSQPIAAAPDVVVLEELAADGGATHAGAVVVDVDLTDITGDAPAIPTRGTRATARPAGGGSLRSKRTTVVALLVVATLALLIVLVWAVMR